MKTPSTFSVLLAYVFKVSSFLEARASQQAVAPSRSIPPSSSLLPAMLCGLRILQIWPLRCLHPAVFSAREDFKILSYKFSSR